MYALGMASSILAIFIARISEAKKEQIMDDSSADTRQVLLDNPKFGQASQKLSQLTAGHKFAKVLNSTGRRYFSPELMEKAKQLVTLGVETVSITYG